MKDRRELSGRDLQIGRQENAHLRVAVLLDDEHLIMVANERGDLECERKRADAERVDVKTVTR